MTSFEIWLAALKQPGPPEAFFKAIDKALAEVVGHKLFTLLYVAPDGKRVKRLYTNMPKEYPVGGYKPVKADDPEVAAAARFAVAARGKSENAAISLNSSALDDRLAGRINNRNAPPEPLMVSLGATRARAAVVTASADVGGRWVGCCPRSHDPPGPRWPLCGRT